jgi:tetracycline repressor-like protein
VFPELGTGIDIEGANIVVNRRCDRALLRGYLEAHRSDIADLDIAAFILATTVEALTHSAVLRHPDILADEKAVTFLDEVTRLVLRYLRAPSVPVRDAHGCPLPWRDGGRAAREKLVKNAARLGGRLLEARWPPLRIARTIYPVLRVIGDL